MANRLSKLSCEYKYAVTKMKKSLLGTVFLIFLLTLKSYTQVAHLFTLALASLTTLKLELPVKAYNILCIVYFQGEKIVFDRDV